MAITATITGGTPREPIPAGNYVARCYQMLHIGTVEETYEGVSKMANKARIAWELPTELKVFSEEKGEQPFVISKEYTLSMHEKSTMRKDLASWRGKDFTEEQAKGFDITRLIGVPCMINIIHKKSLDGTRTYERIAGITPLPRGFECPPAILPIVKYEHEAPDDLFVETLPDFIKDKIKSSLEWKARYTSHVVENQAPQHEDGLELTYDLPF